MKRLGLLVGAASLVCGGAVHAQDAGSPPSGAPACHQTMEKPRYDVSTARYDVPDVTLLDVSGHPVGLRALLGSDEPVALNFIFTTCTTICPVMTATFAQMRRELGAKADGVRFVSISIDPDQDRPEALRLYAAKYGAGWTFLTGSGVDVERTLRAFGAYAGSKMNHRPLTLLKPPHGDWVRIDGLASGGDLAREAEARILD